MAILLGGREQGKPCREARRAPRLAVPAFCDMPGIQAVGAPSVCAELAAQGPGSGRASPFARILLSDAWPHAFPARKRARGALSWSSRTVERPTERGHVAGYARRAGRGHDNDHPIRTSLDALPSNALLSNV